MWGEANPWCAAFKTGERNVTATAFEDGTSHACKRCRQEPDKSAQQEGYNRHNKAAEVRVFSERSRGKGSIHMDCERKLLCPCMHELVLALEDGGEEPHISNIVRRFGNLSCWLYNLHHFVVLLEDQGALCQPIRPMKTGPSLCVCIYPSHLLIQWFASFLYEKLNSGVEIEYLPGRNELMRLVDALSRRPDLHPRSAADEAVELAGAEHMENWFLPEAYDEDSQFQDEEWLQRHGLCRRTDGYVIKCEEDGEKLAVPQSATVILKILYEVHAAPGAGHPGGKGYFGLVSGIGVGGQKRGKMSNVMLKHIQLLRQSLNLNTEDRKEKQDHRGRQSHSAADCSPVRLHP